MIIVVIMMNANINDNDNEINNDDDNDSNSSERHPERHRGGNYRWTESEICIVENQGLLGDEEARRVSKGCVLASLGTLLSGADEQNQLQHRKLCWFSVMVIIIPLILMNNQFVEL